MKKKRWLAKRILLGIAIALCIAWATFPFYWAITTSLRKPAETFTVAGLAIPFLQFKPTLENWAAELKVPENLKAVKNSAIIAVYQCDLSHHAGDHGGLWIGSLSIL
jgi:multiple sugar transport system permease protein